MHVGWMPYRSSIVYSIYSYSYLESLPPFRIVTQVDLVLERVMVLQCRDKGWHIHIDVVIEKAKPPTAKTMCRIYAMDSELKRLYCYYGNHGRDQPVVLSLLYGAVKEASFCRKLAAEGLSIREVCMTYL